MGNLFKEFDEWKTEFVNEVNKILAARDARIAELEQALADKSVENEPTKA